MKKLSVNKKEIYIFCFILLQFFRLASFYYYYCFNFKQSIIQKNLQTAFDDPSKTI